MEVLTWDRHLSRDEIVHVETYLTSRLNGGHPHHCSGSRGHEWSGRAAALAPPEHDWTSSASSSSTSRPSARFPLVPASFPEVSAATVAALVSPQDLPSEINLWHVMCSGGGAVARVTCPCCNGLGNGNPAEPLVGGRQGSGRKSLSGQRLTTQVVWAFERSIGGAWACYDAEMTAALESAWADGPGAILHVTSSVDSHEYIIDLSAMVQTAVLTGETRAVLRRRTDEGEAAYLVTVPEGAGPGEILHVESPAGVINVTVPDGKGEGDVFTVKVNEAPVAGAEVASDGSLTLVGMAGLLERELGVGGSLRAKILAACKELGVDDEEGRRGLHELARECAVMLVGESGLREREAWRRRRDPSETSSGSPWAPTPRGWWARSRAGGRRCSASADSSPTAPTTARAPWATARAIRCWMPSPRAGRPRQSSMSTRRRARRARRASSRSSVARR